MKYKKVYVEITNICNLNCIFCPGNSRDKKFVEIKDFKLLLNKLDGWTDYLYFHLMGEPLMHPEINKLIDLASRKFKINITTNGYLINRISSNTNINQINISLHSFTDYYDKDLDEYLNDIFVSVEKLMLLGTIVCLRLWTKSKYEEDIIKLVEKRYNCKICGNTKIREKMYFVFDKEFIWPDVNNDYFNCKGSCMGLRSHIGVLVDGTVVPCCLDYNGKMGLGNIYKDDLNYIINEDRAKRMKIGFQNNKKVEEMCQHCNFYDRITDLRDGVRNGK